MFVIEQRKSSICLTELLVVLIDFTLVDKSTSNEMICENSNTRNISYLKVSSEEFNWTEAWSLCNNIGSTLPVICNQHEQGDLTNFLKVASIGSSAIWTSGKRTSFNEWKWTNGQPFNSRMVITVRHDSYTHVALKEDRSYAAQNPSSRIDYLCQYSDSSCNSENNTRVTMGCVRPSDDDRAWYDARNQCLKHGGDLAILADADLDILRRSNKLNAHRSYWIGLRKNEWYWTQQITEQSHNTCEEIKYSNWSSDTYGYSLSYECISIDAWNGGWKPSRCTEKKKVVCQISGTTSSSPSSTMSSKSSRPTRSTMTTTILNTAARTVLIISDTGTQSTESVDCQILQATLLACVAQESSTVGYTAFMAVVIGGLCAIVISNSIVALGVRKYYLRRAKDSSNSDEKETKQYQDLASTQRQANPDFTYTELQLQPVYEEVSKRGQ